MTKKKHKLFCGVHIVKDTYIYMEILYPTKTNQEFLVMTKFQQSTPVIAISGTLSRHLIQ